MNKVTEKALMARNVRFTNTLRDNSELLTKDVGALEYLMLQYLKGHKEVTSKMFASLRSAITSGYEPSFNVGHTWPYALIISCFAIARKNAEIWDHLTEEEQGRMNCLMEAFAYMTHLAIADGNEYRTGMRLQGNYQKNWAPNYRLANIPHIILISQYFGGADVLNEMYVDYNHDAFVAKLQKYGFTNALRTFTREGFTTDEGLYIPSTEDMLTTECSAYVVDTAFGFTNYSDGGKGKGIARHFTYNQKEADDITILEDVLTYSHSGGECVTSIGDSYPLAKGDSPSIGREGMFLEFNLPNNKRYSAFYSKLDFVLEAGLLAAFKNVGLWNIHQNKVLYDKIASGIDDLKWKLSEGFYSINNGLEQGVYYADNAFGYSFMMALWDEVKQDAQ